MRRVKRLATLPKQVIMKQVQTTYNSRDFKLDVSLSKAGYEILPVSIIELCKPEHAHKILSEDEYRLVSSMMPCRVAVYQKADCSTIISRMNTGLLSRVFDKTIRDVMAQASQETNKILSAVER